MYNKNMAEIILKVNNLTVEFGGQRIITDLTFEVEEGEILVILGPNGAGKTVLLRTLLNLLPHEGEIKWKEGVKIGYVPQRLPFIKDVPLSVAEFFDLKNISGKEAMKALKLVGLENSFLKKSIGFLSSGQFQRILIAWALAGDPDVLLFDEPTTGIDIGAEETIYSLLKKLKKEKDMTVFLVSHDLNVVYKYASKVLCLNKKMVCCGSPREVMEPRSLAKLFGEEISFYGHTHD